MLRVLIVRHGQTSYNKDLRNQGRADIEMDETGVAQAASLVGALPKSDGVYVSPLRRAVATASAFAQDFMPDERLVERDYGCWEGKTRAEIEAFDAENYAAYRDDPVTRASGGAETGIDVFMRGVSFLHDLFRLHEAGTVVVVTHGGTGSALLAALVAGGPAVAECIRLSNCSISEVVIDRNHRQLVRLNDHSHLASPPLVNPHVAAAAK